MDINFRLSSNHILFISFLKNVFSFKNVWFFILVCVSLPILTITLFPLQILLNIIILFTVILIGGIIFNSTYKFRKSSLFPMLSYNTNFKIIYYLQVLFIMMISTFFCFHLIVFLLYIFNTFNLLLYSFPWQSSQQTFDFFSLKEGFYFMSMSIYQIAISTILLFSMSFMLRRILKTEKSYMFFLFLLLIITIPWGGTINNCFGRGKSEEHFTNLLVFLYGKEKLFTISIIFPFYAPGQILSATFEQNLPFLAMSSNYGTVDMWHWYSSADNAILPSFNEAKNHNPGWRWNILYVLPIVEIFAFTLIGLIIKK